MVEIVSKKENKLLGRTEVVAKISNEGPTLKRVEVKKAIAKKLKADENLVIVNNISSYFGSSDLNIKAKIYDSKESLEKHARPHMIKRNTVEAPAEEASE